MSATPPPTDDTVTGDAPETEAAKIERVDEISSLARSAWFSLLAALAFSAVTLLSIEHADVLIDSRKIVLPLVSIPVPTRLFLTLGAIVLTVLYLNLHLYLIKLWRAFRYAPGDRPNWRLADHIQPWTVNDYALSLRQDCNPRDRTRRHWRNLLTWATVWWATPFVLVWMWCKSLLVREPVITGTVLALLVFVLLFGSHSRLVAHRELKHETRRPRRVWNLGTLAAGLLLGLVGYVTWTAFEPDLTAESHQTVRRLNLDRQDVAGVKGAIPAAAIQREEYRQKWCEIADVPLDLCGKGADWADLEMNGLTVERQRHCIKEEIVAGHRSYRKCSVYFARLDARFQADWLDVRRDTLTKVARADLEKMDLAGLSAEGADLTRALLEGADLSWSNLSRAVFEDAALKTAGLEHVKAAHASFALADLTRTKMQGAHLEDASLEGASLYGADLRRANLVGADLTAADLRGADLTGANISGARLARADLTGAILSDAILTDATGLTQGQLDGAVGNDQTKLPVSNRMNDDGHYPMLFGIDVCWKARPEALAPLLEADDSLEKRYDAYNCEEGVAPARVGPSMSVPRVPVESNVDRQRRKSVWRPDGPRWAKVAEKTEPFTPASSKP